MFDTFTVHRRSEGLVASLEADRVAPDFEGGAEGAGAPDGSQPSSDDAHFADGDGSEEGGAVEGADRHADAAQDDDEEFDEDDDQSADVQERVKKLQNALKKAKRKLGSTRGERQLLKELRDAGFRPQDLYADSREYRRLMAAAQRNPRLMAVLNGSDVSDEPSRGRTPERRPAAKTDEEFTFDDSPDALGFDPNESKANRTLANGLKQVAQLRHQLETALTRLNPDALLERVENIDQGIKRQTQAQVDREWNDSYRAAAKQIKDEGLRKAFTDLILAAKDREGGKGRPATFYVDHYLRLLNVTPQQAARANAAAAATRGRVAERVAQLPRQGQQGGTPAPARRGRETLADVHKRIRTAASPGAR